MPKEYDLTDEKQYQEFLKKRGKKAPVEKQKSYKEQVKPGKEIDITNEEDFAKFKQELGIGPSVGEQVFEALEKPARAFREGFAEGQTGRYGEAYEDLGAKKEGSFIKGIGKGLQRTSQALMESVTSDSVFEDTGREKYKPATERELLQKYYDVKDPTWYQEMGVGVVGDPSVIRSAGKGLVKGGLMLGRLPKATRGLSIAAESMFDAVSDTRRWLDNVLNPLERKNFKELADVAKNDFDLDAEDLPSYFRYDDSAISDIDRIKNDLRLQKNSETYAQSWQKITDGIGDQVSSLSHVDNKNLLGSMVRERIQGVKDEIWAPHDKAFNDIFESASDDYKLMLDEMIDQSQGIGVTGPLTYKTATSSLFDKKVSEDQMNRIYKALRAYENDAVSHLNMDMTQAAKAKTVSDNVAFMIERMQESGGNLFSLNMLRNGLKEKLSSINDTFNSAMPNPEGLKIDKRNIQNIYRTVADVILEGIEEVSPKDAAMLRDINLKTHNLLKMMDRNGLNKISDKDVEKVGDTFIKSVMNADAGNLELLKNVMGEDFIDHARATYLMEEIIKPNKISGMASFADEGLDFSDKRVINAMSRKKNQIERLFYTDEKGANAVENISKYLSLREAFGPFKYNYSNTSNAEKLTNMFEIAKSAMQFNVIEKYVKWNTFKRNFPMNLIQRAEDMASEVVRLPYGGDLTKIAKVKKKKDGDWFAPKFEWELNPSELRPMGERAVIREIYSEDEDQEGNSLTLRFMPPPALAQEFMAVIERDKDLSTLRKMKLKNDLKRGYYEFEINENDVENSSKKEKKTPSFKEIDAMGG